MLVYKDEALIAIMPANKSDKNICSHQGLTYGGLFFATHTSISEINYVLDSIKAFLFQNSIISLEIKGLPTFYQTKLISNVLGTIEGLGADIYRRDKVLAVDYNLPLSIHKTKLKRYRGNKTKGFVIEEDASLEQFWRQVLEPRLLKRHNTKPVHTLAEIELLKLRFPDEIKQYNIYLNEQLLAGITIFEKGNIVKSQYGATTDLGEKERALEYLFIELIYKYKTVGKTYFSMGTVRDTTKPDGFNSGLLRQKLELGCKEFQQNFYRLPIL